jgi:hypothetical protein
VAGDAGHDVAATLDSVDPLGGLRSVRRRVTDPMESLAAAVAERVIDLLMHALDINALLRQVAVNDLLDRVDLNRLLDRVDVDRLLDQVDVGRLLDRVDVNAVVSHLDIDSLVQQTDLGAVIARSSGGVANDALDVVRSQAVGLDEFANRWVNRVWRRNSKRPAGPAALLDPASQP